MKLCGYSFENTHIFGEHHSLEYSARHIDEKALI